MKGAAGEKKEADAERTLEVISAAEEAKPAAEHLNEARRSRSRSKVTPVGVMILALGIVAFLYFARPVVLPVLLASMAAMTFKPFVRWLSLLHIPMAASAAIIVIGVIAVLVVTFTQLGRPAMAWAEDAPEHMADLKSRFQRLFPTAMRTGKAMSAVAELGTTADEKKDGEKKVPTVEVKDKRGTESILNWTGTILGGVVEVFVLLFLLLASGDMFMHKLVHVMPTLKDKKRAVEISHEVQQNISNYLFSISAINLSVGLLVATGLYLIGVPKAAMWGMVATILNFVPYFGPIAGVSLLTVVGLLTFDTLWVGLLPASWYLMLHLLEANIITPILLGRRFALNPVAIFVSLMFWLWLWGIPGALLAVPILVSIKAVCDGMPKAAFVSELIGR